MHVSHYGCLERLQLWGDSPVRWLTTAIFHTTATVAISLAARTYSGMQMGHGEPRRMGKGEGRGRAEKERGSRQGRIRVRNIVGVTEEQSKEDTSVIVSLLVR